MSLCSWFWFRPRNISARVPCQLQCTLVTIGRRFLICGTSNNPTAFVSQSRSDPSPPALTSVRPAQPILGQKLVSPSCDLLSSTTTDWLDGLPKSLTAHFSSPSSIRRIPISYSLSSYTEIREIQGTVEFNSCFNHFVVLGSIALYSLYSL